MWEEYRADRIQGHVTDRVFAVAKECETVRCYMTKENGQ